MPIQNPSNANVNVYAAEDYGVTNSAPVFYLDATTGDNNDNGLSAGTAWQTLDYAITTISNMRFATEAMTATINMADGTYSLNLEFFPNSVAATLFSFQGNVANTEAVIINIAGNINIQNNSNLTFTNCAFYISSGDFAFYLVDSAKLICVDCNIHCSSATQPFTSYNNSYVGLYGTIGIYGNFPNFISGDDNAYGNFECVFALNTNVIANEFLKLGGAYILTAPGCTKTGTATGKRYTLTQRASVFVNGGGATYFPGSVAGSATSGASYDAPAISSASLDTAFGSTQGNLLYRGAASWSVLAPGTSGQFLKTQGAAANPAWADVTGGGSGAGAMTLIQEQLLGGAAASISFTGIAATYKHLRLVLIAAGSTAATEVACTVKFNNDGGANYAYEVMQGFNTTASCSGGSAQTSLNVGGVSASTGVANDCGYIIIDIPNYARTTFNKIVNSMSGHRTANATANMLIQHWSGFWTSTAAINRVDIQPSAGNFVTGSVASLYGVY